MLQPLRERFFAGPRTCNREQLEERSRPEEVEVVGKQVAVVPKPVAGLSGSHPAVLDARQAPLVEADRSDHGGQAPEDAIVPLHEHQKQHGGKSREPERGQSPPPGEEERRSCGECQQPGVAETPVLPGERLACCIEPGEAQAVLGVWTGRHRALSPFGGLGGDDSIAASEED
jgi:hypothetical protein